MSLGVSYKPATLRSSTGRTEFKYIYIYIYYRPMDTVTTLWHICTEFQEDTPVCGNLNFLTNTHLKQTKTEMKLNSETLCQ
jgi:hypothetical protein